MARNWYRAQRATFIVVAVLVLSLMSGCSAAAEPPSIFADLQRFVTDFALNALAAFLL